MAFEMPPGLMAALRENSRLSPQRIVLPESEEENILLAARAALDQGVACPVLLGQPAVLASAAQRFGLELHGMEIIDVTDEAVVTELGDTALRLFPQLSARRVEKKLQTRLNIASLLVAAGRAGWHGGRVDAHDTGCDPRGDELHRTARRSLEAFESVPYEGSGLRGT